MNYENDEGVRGQESEKLCNSQFDYDAISCCRNIAYEQ